jgi:hypothetical protein
LRTKPWEFLIHQSTGKRCSSGGIVTLIQDLEIAFEWYPRLENAGDLILPSGVKFKQRLTGRPYAKPVGYSGTEFSLAMRQIALL